MSVSSFLLMHVFTALLPPPNATEYEYYDCLGLDSSNRNSITLEDIRKAYKKKSLELHPDKIAQRGGNAVAAAAQYERVQEASSILQDVKHRKQYHSFNCSVARYRFVASAGIYNPGAVMENLQQASCINKTRLCLLVSVFFLFMLLQPVLIAAKVNAIVDNETESILRNVDWVILLIPLWVMYGLTVALFAILALVIPEATREFTVTFLEHVSIFTGLILLAMQWDRPIDPYEKNNWQLTAVPFYMAIVWRLYGTASTVTVLRKDQARMISPEHLAVTEHIDNTEDMTEGQREEIAAKYIVVTVDSNTVVAAMQAFAMESESGGTDVTDEDLEAIRVTSSPEFAEAESHIHSLKKSMTVLLLFGVSFCALVASKLEGQIADVSWYVVFIPIFIKLGLEISSSFLYCCCVGVLSGGIAGHDGDDIMMVVPEHKGDVDADAAADADADAAGPDGVREGGAEEQHQEQGNINEEGKAPDLMNNTASLANFAAPEGEIDESKETAAKDMTNGNDELKSEPTRQATATNDETQMNQEAKSPYNNSNGNDGDDDNISSDEPHIKFDEETYRAWHSAQAEADAAMMQERAKAQSTCCSATLQLIMVVLIVVKLEEDYENPDDVEEGFNAFWILSPVFFITGVLLCCCSCLIYGIGAPRPGDEDLFEANSEDGAAGADGPKASQDVQDPASAAAAVGGGKGSVVESTESRLTASAESDLQATPDVEAGGGETINDLD